MRSLLIFIALHLTMALAVAQQTQEEQAKAKLHEFTVQEQIDLMFDATAQKFDQTDEYQHQQDLAIISLLEERKAHRAALIDLNERLTKLEEQLRKLSFTKA